MNSQNGNHLLTGAILGFILGFGGCEAKLYQPARQDVRRAIAESNISVRYGPDFHDPRFYDKTSLGDEISENAAPSSIMGVLTGIFGALIGLGIKKI